MNSPLLTCAAIKCPKGGVMVVIGSSTQRLWAVAGHPLRCLKTALRMDAATDGVLRSVMYAVHRILTSHLALLLCVGMSGTAHGEHNPLLARPQQIGYASSQLALKGFSISLPSGAVDEDWFGAQVLAGCLSRRLGTEVPIVASSTEGHYISLTRTGSVDALPVPDEPPGPNCRETSSVSITQDGGEVRGRSSAAVLLGVQTLCQMAEGHGEGAALPEIRVSVCGELMERSHAGNGLHSLECITKANCRGNARGTRLWRKYEP